MPSATASWPATRAKTAAETDWARIVTMYDLLAKLGRYDEARVERERSLLLAKAAGLPPTATASA